MSRVATYSGPFLRGLGAQSICLDQAENAIDCQNPECTYGDCGAPSSYVPSGGCLDRSQNQVLCNDPECTYGDCLPSTPAPRSPVTIRPGTVQALTAAVAATATPRPANVIQVPLSMSTVGMWLGSNWPVALGIVVIGAVVLGGIGGRRR